MVHRVQGSESKWSHVYPKVDSLCDKCKLDEGSFFPRSGCVLVLKNFGERSVKLDHKPLKRSAAQWLAETKFKDNSQKLQSVLINPLLFWSFSLFNRHLWYIIIIPFGSLVSVFWTFSLFCYLFTFFPQGIVGSLILFRHFILSIH